MPTLDGLRSMERLSLASQRALIRVDFDVPLDEAGALANDRRIVAALPTISHAVSEGARVILASHLGRPAGKRKAELSLEPVGVRLAELLGQEVYLPDECVGDAAKKVVADLRPGQVCLLENLRFFAEEEQNDEAFARKLAALADVYVNDAFGCSHRAHASLSALPRLIKERAMGQLLQRELEALSRLTESSEQPFVAVLGGAGLSHKLGLLEALLKRCRAICFGGALANTLLAARGHDMKASACEPEQLALARALLARARDRNVEVILPVDVVVAEQPDASAGEPVSIGSIPDRHMALDIGPRTLEIFQKRLLDAKLVFWNGPLGASENPAFSAGSLGFSRALSEAPGFSIVGGEDSAALLSAAGDDVARKVDFVSYGGAASLQLIEGKKLPGVEALRG